MFIIPDASQVSQFIQELQSLAQAAGHTQPLLIGLELEGALVRRNFLKGTLFPHLYPAFLPTYQSTSSNFIILVM